MTAFHIPKTDKPCTSDLYHCKCVIWISEHTGYGSWCCECLGTGRAALPWADIGIDQ